MTEMFKSHVLSYCSCFVDLSKIPAGLSTGEEAEETPGLCGVPAAV